MSNHTPGPWLIVSTYVRTAINTAQGIHVAMVNWGKGISVKEHEANAHLIAAAPDMLEALEAFLEVQILEEDDYADVKDLIAADKRASDMMMKALKKARGEE